MKRILIADDDVHTAKSLGEGLRQMSYEIQLAHNGKEALKMARDFKPHITILNVGMPGMNGFQVFQELKATPENATLETIFTSASREPLQESFACALGALAYMTKPLDLEKIAKALKGNNQELLKFSTLMKSSQDTIELSPEEIDRLRRTLLSDNS